MKSLRIVFQFGLLIGLGIAIPGLPTTAQSTSPNQVQPPTSRQEARERRIAKLETSQMEPCG